MSDDRLKNINSTSINNSGLPDHFFNEEDKSSGSQLSPLRKTIFSRPYLIVATAAVIFASSSIYAQIKNIYDSTEDNISGITSLMSAVASNDINGVKFFAKAGPASINQKNFGGATALHIAAREGNLEIAKILIENGANVNAVDNEGWTPLMRSSLAANKEIVDLLLSKNTQAELLNFSKESAIFHAASSDCNDCLGLLFEKFNFVQFMDIDSLRTQLTNSFVVARNHENQVAQDMISAYLDRVYKITSANVSKNPEKIETEKNGKKFVFKSDGEKTIVTEELPQAPVNIIKNKENTFTQKELENTSSEAPKNSLIKFKFVVGEQGKYHKKTVKIVNDKESEGAISENMAVINPQKKDPVTFVFKKTKPIKDEVIVETAAPINGMIYKFKSGPSGKKIKRKIEKKTEIKPINTSLSTSANNTTKNATETSSVTNNTHSEPTSATTSADDSQNKQPSNPAPTPSAPTNQSLTPKAATIK